MVIIKVKKGLRKNIMGSLLLGSSIVAITPAQASQGLFPPSERKSTDLTEEEKAKIEKEKREKRKKDEKRHQDVRNGVKRQRNEDFRRWHSQQIRYACQPKTA
jgi:hypothetical protein